LSSYHVVEPEVAGGWGKNTDVIRIPGQPVVVNKLHYVFDGWLGDELLESTPCYIGTERLVDEIKRAKLRGVVFDEVEIAKSEQFDELYPNRELPKFMWLKMDGTPGEDDFGVTTDLQLVVSDEALAVLQRVGLSNAFVEPFAS
jgi:hypothetical protein